MTVLYDDLPPPSDDEVPYEAPLPEMVPIAQQIDEATRRLGIADGWRDRGKRARVRDWRRSGDDAATDLDEPPDAASLGAARIDWAAFWTLGTDAEWLVEPVIARGRGHAVYAPAKAGKSILLLWIAAHAATGRAVLDRPAGTPITVVYVDLEMTGDDVRERLTDMGFGPDDDLSRLVYLSLPALVPLDTARGAAELVAYCTEVGAELVIIDTTARAVEGAENDADTYRAFALHTGIALKRARIAFIRSDHAGKDLDRGQRGSSAKNDDVDIVWQLTPAERGARLKRTHTRMGWVPDHVSLVRTDEPLGYQQAASDWPAGTQATAQALDDLDIALGATVQAAQTALKAAGRGTRRAVISAALKWRRTREPSPETPAAHPTEPTTGTTSEPTDDEPF